MKKLFSYDPEATSSATNIIIILLVILTFALIVIGPSITRINWGFNQVNHLPTFLYYVWLLLALAMIALLFLSPREHFVSAMLSKYLWGDKKLTGRTAVLLTALIIFFVFRFDAHLYGNGYTRMANFTQKTKPIFRWFEYGETLIPYIFYLVLTAVGVAKVNAGIWAYQIISFLSGIGFIFVTFKMSEFLADNDDNRFTFFLLTVFTGIILFFFGMIENFPILLFLSGWFIYFNFRLVRLNKSKYLYYLWGIQIFGLFLSIQFITALPATLYLSIKHLTGRTKTGNFLSSLVAILAILSMIAIVYLKSVGNIALSSLILFPTGKPPDTDYSLFSLRRLADLLNLFILLVPIFAVYIFSIIRGFGRLKNDSNFAALGYLTISQLLYLFIIDPRSGMARDIHLYGFLLTGFIFWGIYSLLKIQHHVKFSQNIFMALCPISLVLILPVLYVHLSPAASEKYIDDFLTYNETKYEPALIASRNYYTVKKDYEKAGRREQAITGKAPGVLESQLVNDLYARERVNEAFEYAIHLVERYPYNAVYRMQKGNLLKHYKRYDDAEKELKTAIELSPYRLEFYHFLSELYRGMKLEWKCYQTLEQAASIDPENVMILVDLTGFYLRLGRIEKADSLSNVIIGLDPEEPYAYMYKGLISEKLQRRELAQEYYEKFIEMNDRLPEVPVIRKRLNKLVLEMRDTTSRK